MTDTHLYLAIGVPTLALIMGMIGNGLLFSALSARMTSLENRMSSIDARFGLLMGKLSDIDTRLGILEDRSRRP